jgi:hypothetical protein
LRSLVCGDPESARQELGCPFETLIDFPPQKGEINRLGQ